MGDPRHGDDGCVLTTDFSRRCQTDPESGKLRCETLRRKWRHCPGRAPELLERTDLETDASDAAPLHSTSPWSSDSSSNSSGDRGLLLRPPPDVASLFQSLERMEAMMGMLFGPPRAMPRRPHNEQHDQAPLGGTVRIDEV